MSVTFLPFCEPPILFDEELCRKPAAVIRGIQFANERKIAINSLPSPVEESPAGGLPPAPTVAELLTAAKAFRVLRTRALEIAGEGSRKTAFPAAEKYIAEGVRDLFEAATGKPVEAKVFGLAGAVSGGDINAISFINTCLRMSCANILLSLGKTEFVIAGGTHNSVHVTLSSFVKFSPEDWDGIYLNGEA